MAADNGQYGFSRIIIVFQPLHGLSSQSFTQNFMLVKMAAAVLVNCHTAGFSDVVEKGAETEQRFVRYLGNSAYGMLPYRVDMMAVFLIQPEHRTDFRNKMGDDFPIVSQGFFRGRPAQQLVQLHSHPFRGNLIQQGTALVKGLIRFRVNPKTQLTGKADGPHNAQSVFTEPFFRISHAADDPSF